jgi:hypothetical protein
MQTPTTRGRGGKECLSEKQNFTYNVHNSRVVEQLGDSLRSEIQSIGRLGPVDNDSLVWAASIVNMSTP